MEFVISLFSELYIKIFQGFLFGIYYKIYVSLAQRFELGGAMRWALKQLSYQGYISTFPAQ